MSGLELNKMIAAILTAGVIAMASGFVSHLLFQTKEAPQHAYPVTVEAAAPATTQEAVTAVLEPIGPLLASADIEAGAKAARKCGACHTVNEGGANKIGPNLWDIVNRSMASTSGFKYSAAFQGMAGGSWTYEKLNAFLSKPKEMVPGTKMQFAGLRKTKDRANLVAYLRSLSGDPAPLPE